MDLTGACWIKFQDWWCFSSIWSGGSLWTMFQKQLICEDHTEPCFMMIDVSLAIDQRGSCWAMFHVKWCYNSNLPERIRLNDVFWFFLIFLLFLKQVTLPYFITPVFVPEIVSRVFWCKFLKNHMQTRNVMFLIWKSDNAFQFHSFICSI